MRMKVKVTLPRQMLTARQIETALTNLTRDLALGAQADFYVTTQTWNTKVEFPIKAIKSGHKVSTKNKIYGFVNDGTKPHIITPKKPGGVLRFGSVYVNKTTPRVVASRPGGYQPPYVFVKQIQHPGNPPRDFDSEIADKWSNQVEDIWQRILKSLQ